MSRLTPALAEEIRQAAVELLPLGRERLRLFAHAESPTGDATALNTMLRLLEDGHREAGGRCRRHPGPRGDHLVSAWGSDTGPHLLLLGHHDTVWPVGRLATMPYTDDGAWITGPGVYDMKGGLVVLEMAMRVLRAVGVAPARPVRAVAVADEEIGSPTGCEVVREHLAGAVAVLGLEPPHPSGALKTGRRGSTRVRLHVQGREAHAALNPGRGVSAIDELLDQLAAARAAVPGDGSTLFNIGTIGGGTRTNVVAGEAWAEIGLRFASAEVERRVLGALRTARPRRAGAQVTVELLSSRPTWEEPRPNPLLDAVRRVGELLGQEITGAPASGAGDTNLAGAAGVPALDGFGPVGRGAHAPDEAVRVPALADRAALLAALLCADLGTDPVAAREGARPHP